MRLSWLVRAAAPLAFFGCQDSYASNPERDTHMGALHAAVPEPEAPHTMGFVQLPPGSMPAPAVSAASAAPDAGAADAGASTPRRARPDAGAKR